VQPELIVTLGNVALKALLGKNAVIGAYHGQVTRAEVQGQAFQVFPLYHPASVIYNRSLTETYQEDLLKLKTVI